MGDHLMDYLDGQMQQWHIHLRDDLKILPPESNRLASVIAEQVCGLSPEGKRRVKDASVIPLESRLEELVAFQKWMDLARDSRPVPPVVRAQVITELYICFVYLGETCFKVLRDEFPKSSTVGKCCDFLTQNPVRALRNAVAHSNWCYLADFSGLEFWARKGGDAAEPPLRFTVSNEELGFWQALARCTAYAAYTSLCPGGPPASGSILTIQ